MARRMTSRRGGPSDQAERTRPAGSGRSTNGPRGDRARAAPRCAAPVLERAFRGELVPQDPSDEPASVLLDRIRAEQAKSGPATGRRHTAVRLSPIVEEYLQRIERGRDGWAVRVASPVTARPIILVEPRRALGQPIFVHGAAPVDSIVVV